MDQKQQLLLDATRRLIRREAFPNLAKLLAKSHPADIAHLFRYLDLKEQRILFHLIGDAEKSAYVLAELDHVTGSEDLRPFLSFEELHRKALDNRGLLGPNWERRKRAEAQNSSRQRDRYGADP